MKVFLRQTFATGLLGYRSCSVSLTFTFSHLCSSPPPPPNCCERLLNCNGLLPITSFISLLYTMAYYSLACPCIYLQSHELTELLRSVHGVEIYYAYFLAGVK